MSYERQNFLENQVVTEAELNHMEDGIIAACHVQNLLDNSDFTNPVNQRGASSYDSEQYAIDRWRVYDSKVATCTVDSDSITVNSRLYQTIPGDGFDTASPYTLAACDSDGNIRILTTKTLKSSTSNDYMGFEYSTTSCVIIYLATGTWKWAALYKGEYTEDTLPAYVPKGFAAEYAECQRYYVSPVGRFTPVVLTDTTTARMTITTLAPMYKVPTAKLINGDNIILNNGSGQVLSVTDVAVDSMEGNHVYLSLTCSTGPQYATGFTFVTSISLSADI